MLYVAKSIIGGGMEKLTDIYNLIIGGIIAIMTMVFGQYYTIFIAYVILNTLDWLTRWHKSRRLKQESGKEGAKGAIKKAGYWVIITVAFLIPYMLTPLGEILNVNFDFTMLFGWLTLACLTVNEARSILENLTECGYKVPHILIKGLKVADNLINKEEKKDEV